MRKDRRNMKKTNRKIKEILKTRKRGGASMFVVLFTIIILSVIVLSFTRLIVSESLKTTNVDLSQSAYDSAMAGIEDAKIALLKYHECLDRGVTSAKDNTCGNIIKNMQEGIESSDCSTVANVLGRTVDGENGVTIQETKKGDDPNNMLQAYTCVTIKEDLNDYRTTLSSEGRLRVIPIRADNIDSIDTIKLRWFSPTNVAKAGEIMFCGNSYSEGDLMTYLYPSGKCPYNTSYGYQAPSTLMVRLIQTDPTFNLSELSVSNNMVNKTKVTNATDTGEVMLIPTDGKSSDGVNVVTAANWYDSANKGTNVPIRIKCKENGDWLCTADITLPNTFKNKTNRHDGNTYLLVSLPYGMPETDISIATYGNVGGETEQIEFSGVQARIDSTGRANDLYRRVETRVELVDTYFAYPEFEITMTGADSNIYKSFYATFNCWRADNGELGMCRDSYEDLNMN